MTRKEELIHEIQSKGADSYREAANAELNSILAQELIEEMRRSTNLIYQNLASLGSEIVKHRDEIRAASESSSKSAQAVVDLTAALVRTTKAYVWLTGGLLLAATLNVVVVLLKHG